MTRTFTIRYYSVLALILAIAPLTKAQQQAYSNRSKLTIERIMQGERFIGYSPDNFHWSEDGQWLYFDWNPQLEASPSKYKIKVDGGSPEPVSAQEQMAMPARNGQYNRARNLKVYEKHGDIFLFDIAAQKTKAVTFTVERESAPLFSGDETHIVYRSGNNLFAWSISEGTTRQITNFVSGSKPREKQPNERDQWLIQEQLDLSNVLKERKHAREANEKLDEQLKPGYPEPIYLGEKSVSNLRISPDMQYVTCWLMPPRGNDRTKVPNFVTESGYTEDIYARAKVGEVQESVEMGIYNVAKDSLYSIATDGIEGIKDKPAYLKEYHTGSQPYNPRYDKARPVVIHGPFFSDAGHAVVEVKSFDNKDRWIMMLDLSSGSLKELDRQHDEAWIGGPGISSWNWASGNIGWIDAETIFFQSEETGYSHLYSMHIMSEEKRALTSGKFEVLEAYLSNDKQSFYMLTNEGSPFEQHFYRMSTKGGARERITSKVGAHEVQVSPDEKQLAIRYSGSNQPWELFVMPNQANASMRQLTISTTRDFEDYSWRTPNVVTFPASDGAQVPARVYLPDNPGKDTPAVIFVHGAGYLQNAHKWWSSYYREFMFHNFLADNGYAVIDIDYRGSSGYGRDWRTGIYRHMGGKDLSDQVDGAKYLVQSLGINPNNIGIYGGSYGGFITLMGMFKHPNTFKCGAALRSVTDWAHYNHGYTSNILNTPATDSLAYVKSSPIYHAEGLQGELLILHGMVDDNVHFQDVVRLSQRLIELGKDNWEMAVFPVEPHGFVEPSSWIDEYKRIYRLFERNLTKK